MSQWRDNLNRRNSNSMIQQLADSIMVQADNDDDDNERQNNYK